MNRPICFSFCTLFFVCLTSPAFSQGTRLDSKTGEIDVAADDWAWWRGPQHDGSAPAGQSPPIGWSSEKNVLWKAPVSGRGHGSPIVVGDQVVLATADEKGDRQLVLCFNRNTGDSLWSTVVHKDGIYRKGNKKASQASSTLACDGKRFFVNFLHKNAIFTTALNRDGTILWQTKISDYKVHQGYGSSPLLYKNLVIVSADNKGGGAIAALHRGDGSVVWRHDRPKEPNYSSPVIVKAAGKEQLVFIGCDLVSAFAPESGEKLWEHKGATTECVTTTVTNGELIYTTGGYPKNHVAGVKADGSGEVVWENKTRVYVPSLLIKDGFLYASTDGGVATCWNAATGEEMWQGRLGGGFTSSPVLVGDKIYATNEDGMTFIFAANPKKFELLGKNQLGNAAFATPTFCHNCIYHRVVEETDKGRQEMLYCIGIKE